MKFAVETKTDLVVRSNLNVNLLRKLRLTKLNIQNTDKELIVKTFKVCSRS